MNGSVTVIDIVAQVTDETSSGARSAEANVSRLERSMMNLQKQIMGMKGKSKLEVAATLKDMASKGIQGVADAGKKIAGKVWTVTLKAVDLVTAPFKKVWGLISSPVTQMAAFAGVSVGMADTINTFKNFEQGMANVKAITGNVSNEALPGVMQAAKDMGVSFEMGADATQTAMNALTATAQHLGETTMFSATQAAEAMENLAMAGWKAEDIMRAMPGLLDLAAAGGVELATASDVVTSAIAQFQLNAEDASHVADVLAATATNSKTDISGLGESFKMVGMTANSLGYSLEDTAWALGVMGNAGLDASMAGTSLNTALGRLAKGEGLSAEESTRLTEAFNKMGVSLVDDKGHMKGLQPLLKEMAANYNKLDAVEKKTLGNDLFGAYGEKAAVALFQGAEAADDLYDAITNCNGAAAEMANKKMDTLQGSLQLLQSAAEGVQIAIGKKLSPYVRRAVDWLTAHMPDIQNAVGSAVDFVLGKIDSVSASIRDMTNSPEWANAETLWDKIKIAWDKLIAEPFDTWWNGTGKAWIAEKANSIGEGFGTALKTGILALLGVDVGGAAADGLDIGKSFADGFLEGFDGSKVGEALAKAIKDGLKSLVLDAATLLPGGREASPTSILSAAALGYGAYRTAKTARGIYRGGKALVNGTKAVGNAIGNVTGINTGIRMFRTGMADFAGTGQLGLGGKIGVGLARGASKVGNVLSKVTGPLSGAGARTGKFLSKAAGPALAGIISMIQMGTDAYHGTQMAEKWTGSDSTGNKAASGIGAMLGGLGDGLLGNENIVRKTSNLTGGALKGAGIGAVAGSILPGVGTAIGGAVGAGVGAAGAAIGGSNIAKALSSAGEAVGGFFTKTVPEKFSEFTEGAKGFFDSSIALALSTAGTAVKGFFTETVPKKFGEFQDGVAGFVTETVPQALSSAGSAVKGFFTETVPEKFGELVDGIGGFFTETVPYAIGYAAGKVQVFFTQTVPQFFGNLVEGVTNFFTQTVPAAIETAGAAISNFFTVTVPTFFGNLWSGVVGFFTETVPATIEAVGSAVSNFFTATVPQFFSNLWSGITGFFTDTVQPAIETVGAAVTNFFTVTVPEFFTGLWEGITGFFTETVPQALETVGTALSTFFTETIPQKMQEVWDGVVNLFSKKIPNAINDVGETISGFFSNVKEKISGFFGSILGKVTGSANAGYQAAVVTPHAEGGIMTRPHIGLVAEDGAEAIIPLSGNRRERGIDLWERTGQMLGVKPYAEGGIIGGNSPEPADAPTPAVSRNEAAPSSAGGSGGMSVPVTIQSLTVEINIDGGGQNPQELTAAIRENIRGMTDDIAYQLAEAIQQVYSNTPKEGWR